MTVDAFLKLDSLSLVRPKPVGVFDWKARISIRTLPSSTAPPDTEAIPPASDDPANTLAPHLCYACHTMLTSRSPRSIVPPPGGTALPLWAGPGPQGLSEGLLDVEPDGIEGELRATKGMDRSDMKEAISDFLLDE